MTTADALAILQKRAAERGLSVVVCNNESSVHWQIQGGDYLVNIFHKWDGQWTVYVAQTRASTKNLMTMQMVSKAISSATDLPEFVPGSGSENRRKSYKRARGILWRSSPYCYWCGARLQKEEATIDHLIPLCRGGSDGMDNFVLSCKPCNEDKADYPASRRREFPATNEQEQRNACDHTRTTPEGPHRP